MADPTTSAGYFHHRPRKVKANPKDLAPRGVVTPSILSPASSSLASLRDSTFDLSEPNIGRHLRSFPSSDTSLSAASEDETKRHIALRVDREDQSQSTGQTTDEEHSSNGDDGSVKQELRKQTTTDVSRPDIPREPDHSDGKLSLRFQDPRLSTPSISEDELETSDSSTEERVLPPAPTRAAPEIPATIAETEFEPERDLILPAPLSSPSGAAVGPVIDTESSEDVSGPETAVKAKDPEKHGQGEAAPQDKVGFFGRAYLRFRRAYAPKTDPELILPTGPTDKEKYSYLKTNRWGLYALGIFSFLSLSAGMWLFVLSSTIFSWFGFFFGLMQIYLIISYMVGLVGKDFDFESHKKALEEHPVTPDTAPTVDIYLPCCKEPLDVLENTYKHIQALQYPEGKLKVFVMDDGAMDSVKQLAESYGFTYLCRDDRPRLKKAGNLRWTFARTSGDFFTIYDADFCPRPDFLLELLPQHLADDKTAIIQSPQFFRTSDEQTWVEQGASAVQELFYRVVQVNRNRWGASICVGSNAVYRRAALEEVGGTAEIGFSEDVHTGFGAVDRGWKVKYVPLCLACGICPDTPRAFFSQQMRWCMGSTTLLTNPEFWTSRLSLIQKVCYLCGMMYYSAMALGIFISPVPGIFLLWLRPEFFKYYNLAFAVPSIMYGLLGFRFWAKASYGINVQYIMVIQSYAYLTAIKDRLFGKALAWVPSGDNKSHKNHKYRNMRIVCACWTLTVIGALAGACTYRLMLGMKFYNIIPICVLNLFNLLLAHRFLFYHG